MIDIEELKRRVGYQDLMELEQFTEHGAVSHLVVEKHADASAKIDKNKQMKRLRDHLSGLPNEQLLDMLMESITSRPREWDKWQFTLALKDTKHMDHGGASMQSLTDLLIKALPEKQVWDWYQVKDYFEDADDQFEIIFAASEQLILDEQWQFCMAAIERLNLVLEQIDDSGGARFYIEGQLNENISKLFEQLTWPDDDKAQWLVDQLADARLDIFPCVPEDFRFSDDVEVLFLAKCADRVQIFQQDRNNTHTQIEDEKDNWSGRYSRLIAPLITNAQRNDDWQEHCRLLALTANSARNYLQISQICLDKGEALDAETWLVQAKKCASGVYERKQCDEHEVTVCLALGEHSFAWQKAWQIFCQFPSFAAYRTVETLHQQLGEPDEHFLVAVERVLADDCAVSSKTSWATNDSVLTFYLYQEHIEKAREWTKKHQASDSNLIKLAKLTLLIQPAESMALLHRVLAVLIGKTNNDAYGQALDLLLEIKTLIAAGVNHDVAEQEFDTLLLDLVQKFKIKRNMMKLLRQNFPHCF
ncbi:hypothetical protein [Shewanella sp.]|uniref:hypothetical protein n=1 Tax=Shewanella sp. TaxID=50422 RepID=UPI001ECC397B|nr:hypothetical protein [Shewanella sp.]NRB24588.1 hypothetical protein [Shewanella sp.]